MKFGDGLDVRTCITVYLQPYQVEEFQLADADGSKIERSPTYKLIHCACSFGIVAGTGPHVQARIKSLTVQNFVEAHNFFSNQQIVLVKIRTPVR